MSLNELNKEINSLLLFNKHLIQSIDFDSNIKAKIEDFEFDLDIDFKVVLYKENVRKLNKLLKEKEKILIEEGE